MAVVVAGSALSIPLIPNQGNKNLEPVIKNPGDTGRGKALGPGVLALVACFVFNMGIMMVWAYLERIGNAAGLPGDYIGRTLGLSLVAALAGA